jgi:hypothetical protein
MGGLLVALGAILILAPFNTVAESCAKLHHQGFCARREAMRASGADA